jgi:uncharacterized cupin superfamily protein
MTMDVVVEMIDVFPHDRPVRSIKRDERRLFERPGTAQMKFLTADIEPLKVYTLPSKYAPVAFGPPRGVFEGPYLRLEWQNINGRQPFYHRNADADEIGFQICGERTLMTELGTLELRAGDFSCIPVTVAHDNFGREDIHLIFYLHGPAISNVPPHALGKYQMPPFEGWEEASKVEVSTNGLGGPRSDVASGMTDERMLLDAARDCKETIQVLRAPEAGDSVEWIYKAPRIWIGHTRTTCGARRTYQRHMGGDEIQYQVSGTRTLLSQRGVVTLEAGDFVCIPLGCAFASIAQTESRHISVLTAETTPPVRDPSRSADVNFAGFLDTLPANLLEVSQ